MKKIIYGFLALFTIASVVPTISMANDNVNTFNQGDVKDNNKNNDGNNRGAGFGETANTSDFYNAGAAGIGGHGKTAGASLLTSIKKFINWALGMLATVALVLCLYGGFNMMTAGGDENKYKNGINILKKAAIGLVVIGGAWMLVSIVMWLIGNVTAEGSTSTGS